MMNKIERAGTVVGLLGILGTVATAACGVDFSTRIDKAQAAIDTETRKGDFFEVVPSGEHYLSIKLKGDIGRYKEVHDITGTFTRDNRVKIFEAALDIVRKDYNVVQAWGIPDPQTKEFSSLLVLTW